MAREEVEHLWCDRCLRLHRQKKPARALVVTYDGEEVLRSELCELHRTEALRQFRKALPRKVNPRGRDPHRNDRRKVGPFACQICRSQCKHRDTLGQHVKRVHDIAFQEYLETYGQPRTMTAAELAEEIRFDCTVCGATYSTPEVRLPYSALIAHVRGRHGLRLMPGGELVPVA